MHILVHTYISINQSLVVFPLSLVKVGTVQDRTKTPHGDYHKILHIAVQMFIESHQVISSLHNLGLGLGTPTASAIFLVSSAASSSASRSLAVSRLSDVIVQRRWLSPIAYASPYPSGTTTTTHHQHTARKKTKTIDKEKKRVGVRRKEKRKEGKKEEQEIEDSNIPSPYPHPSKYGELS